MVILQVGYIQFEIVLKKYSLYITYFLNFSYLMACYEYHSITFPFSRKNKNSSGQVSDRSATLLATSVLHDLGLVSPIDRSKVIDRSKIRRERRKNRKEL